MSTYPLAGVLTAALVLSCADGDGAGRVAVVERTCSVTSSCADEAIEEVVAERCLQEDVVAVRVTRIYPGRPAGEGYRDPVSGGTLEYPAIPERRETDEVGCNSEGRG